MRWTAGLGAVVLLAVALSVPAAAVGSTVSVRPSGTSGPTLSVDGSTARSARGQKVALQVLSGRSWITIGRTTVSSARRFTVVGKPVLSRASYRVHLSARGSVRAATSRRFAFSGRLSVQPATAVEGESVQVGGRLPTRIARRVTLERRQDGAWTTSRSGRTSSAGIVTVTVPATSATWRLTAPRVRVGRTTYAAWSSPSVAWRPARQTASIQASSAAVAGQPFGLEAVFSPARPGRPVTWQRYQGGAWTDLDHGTQDARGRATVSTTEQDPGSATFRVVAAPHHGATPVASEPLAMQVADAPTEPGSGHSFPTATTSLDRISGEPPTDESIDFEAVPGHSLSSDGRFLVYSTWLGFDYRGSPYNGRVESYIYDRSSGQTRRIAEGLHGAAHPTISADGRWVAFTASSALVTGDGNTTGAVMLWDRQTGTVRRISRTDAGAATISADGAFVVYSAQAPRGNEAYPDATEQTVNTWSRATGVTTVVSRGVAGSPERTFETTISADGRFIAYIGSDRVVRKDETSYRALLLWDRTTQRTTLVSRRPNGSSATVMDLSMSDDARHLVFTAVEHDLVPGHGEHEGYDVYSWDRSSGATSLVSDEVVGGQAQDGQRATVSPDGRYVFYRTARSSTFPVPTDSGLPQIVRWDRATGDRALVTRDRDGRPLQSWTDLVEVSRDGSQALFTSNHEDTSNDGVTTGRLYAAQVAWTPGDVRPGFSRMTDAAAVSLRAIGRGSADPGITLVSRTPSGAAGKRESIVPMTSANGRYVAFVSGADDLDPADLGDPDWPLAKDSDIFVWDRTTGLVDRVTDGVDGAGANDSSFSPQISADGRFVAYISRATNLVADDEPDTSDYDVFLWDRQTGSTRLVTPTPADRPPRESSFVSTLAMSPDGSHLAFWFEGALAPYQAPPKDGRTGIGLVRWSRATGTFTVLRVPKTYDGGLRADRTTRLSVSDEGRRVAFVSTPHGLYQNVDAPRQAWVWDVASDQVVLVSSTAAGAPGNGPSDDPAISADGRSVAFSSFASDLVPSDGNDDSDVFARDLGAGTTKLVSRARSGAPGAGSSQTPSISADGTSIAFSSTAYDLDPSDDNQLRDIFVWRSGGGPTRLVSRSTVDGGGVRASRRPSISGDGRHVVFESEAWNFGPLDGNGTEDVYSWTAP